MPNYYPISEETARRAKEAYSWSDYKPGSATAEYRASVDACAAEAEQQKKRVSPFYHDRIDAAVDRYAKRLAEWTDAYNRNVASCPSSFITGGSNYNKVFGNKHARMLSREDRLWQEHKEIEAIRESIRGIGSGPVDLNDPHAREILTERAEKLRRQHEHAKAVNAHFKKHGTFKGFPGVDDAEAARLDAEMKQSFAYSMHGKPYPDYELTSLRNRIKTAEARLAELDALDARRADPAGADDAQTFDGGEIVRNAELNRLQIVFDHVPAAEIREALKSNGFHWSPKNKAWQRQLTRNAEIAARAVLGLA